MKSSENDGKELHLNQQILLFTIDKYPGLRYRELLRLTGFSNGVLSYHLSNLIKGNRINSERTSKNPRYYPISMTTEICRVIGILRLSTNRNIVSYILDTNFSTFSEIVKYSNKSPSTISQSLKELNEQGIISIIHSRPACYTLKDREKIREILSNYHQSFVDKVIDNYIDMVEGL